MQKQRVSVYETIRYITAERTFAGVSSLNIRPAVRGEREPVDAERWRACIVAVVVVIDQRWSLDATHHVREDTLAARSCDVVVRTQYDGAAAVGETQASAIDKGSIRILRSAGDDAIRAGRTAAHVDGCEVEVILRAVDHPRVDERSLFVGTARGDHRVRSRIGGRRHARCGIKLDDVDAILKRAEAGPPVAGGVDEGRGIDGVPGGRRGKIPYRVRRWCGSRGGPGRNDVALVRPGPIGSGTGGKTDDGLSSGRRLPRNCVIEVIGAVCGEQTRRPHIDVGAVVVGRRSLQAGP